MLEVFDEEKKIPDFKSTEFPWRGVEEVVTFKQALEEVKTRIRFEEAEQKKELEGLLTDALLTAENIYDILHGTSGSTVKPFYHNLGHVQWTLIHALRAEVGHQILSGNEFADLTRIKLTASVALFHEVEEWWTYHVYEGYIDAITSQLRYCLQRNNIDPLDFDRVLALLDFGKSIDETVEETLTAGSTREGMVSGQKLHLEQVDSRQAQEKLNYLKSVAQIIRGADYAQCLDLEYQRKVTIRYKDYDTGEIDEQELPAGSIMLALEFARYRPKAPKLFGWGERGKINWKRVGPDSYFYHNFFYPDISPLLKYWKAYYQDPSQEPYSERFNAFRKVVKETDLRILKLARRQARRKEKPFATPLVPQPSTP